MEKAEQKIVLVLHNIRSTHNVGSLFRTANGMGVAKIYISGYTPYPIMQEDVRLPHLRNKIEAQIHKTALGAEKSTPWELVKDLETLVKKLKQQDYCIAALEQTGKSVPLNEFTSPHRIALIAGNEVNGIDQKVLGLADIHLEIPMAGSKESFNVAIASAIALYHLRFSIRG